MNKLRSLFKQKIYLSALGVTLTLLVMAAYLIAAVLDTPLTTRPKEITVEMTSTGGLFDGSAVTYRGVKIGKITEVKLNEKGIVEATAALVTTEKIPKDSVVKVRSLSPVGEQYVDFHPKGTEGPYLEDGDRIPATTTELPETLAATVVNVKGLLDQIDADDLHTALKEVAIGLEGTGEGIGQLVDQGEQLLKDLDENWPVTERLLANGNTVLKIAPAEADSIATLATSSRQLAEFLRNYDPTLRSMLDQAPTQLEQLGGLLKDAERLLPTLLDRSITLNDLLGARDPHVRELLAQYPAGVSRLADTFDPQRGLVLNAILGTQNICVYDTQRRNPKDPVRRPFQTNGHCAASFNGLVRGAAHAPPPLR